MLYVLSILGVFLEVSLPFNANFLVVALSFLVYLIGAKREKNILIIGIMAFILSLQTNDFFVIMTVFICGYYLLDFLFLHLSYSKSNILIFSLIQGVIYAVLSYRNLKATYVVANIIGFVVLNYVYICISKRKDKSIKG